MCKRFLPLTSQFGPPNFQNNHWSPSRNTLSLPELSAFLHDLKSRLIDAETPQTSPCTKPHNGPAPSQFVCDFLND